MKGLYLRIDEKLDRELAAFCRREGFKKSGLILKLLRVFLEKWKNQDYPLIQAENFGIDLSLLKENLEKSPTERLKNHAKFHQAMSKIRGVANR